MKNTPYPSVADIPRYKEPGKRWRIASNVLAGMVASFALCACIEKDVGGIRTDMKQTLENVRADVAEMFWHLK